MPINRVVNGDLIKMADEGKFDAIVHGCNCFNTMGAGIAKQIKNRFPLVYDVDCMTHKGDWKKLGDLTSTHIHKGSCDFYVINAYTQYDYKGKSPIEYLAIKNCFTEINEIFPDCKVGIPKIGAGLAGGHWGLIEEIINTVTPNLDITLVVYEG